jgi:hypothetical protein
MTMLKRNGKVPFNIRRKRTLAGLHSAKWKLVEKQFIPVKTMV